MSANAINTAPRDDRRALAALLRDYADIGSRSRIALRLSQGPSNPNFDVSVVGVIRPKRQLILTAPKTPDGSLIAVRQGQSLMCHWFSATTAFRFRATIVRIQFEPIPLLHMELPPVVDRRTVRGVPRALSTLRGRLNDVDVLVVDVSVSGARIALAADVPFEKGQELSLNAKPHMLQRDFELNVRCQVTGPVGADSKHPGIQFLGVNFLDVSDATLLTLHAYVNECLAFETDTLSQVLLSTSKEVDSID